MWPDNVTVDVNIAANQVDDEQATTGLRRREGFHPLFEEMLSKNRPGEIAVYGVGGEVEMCRGKTQ